MDKKEKQQLSEIDICDLFITPAIKNAGWDQMRQVRREVTLTPGPVIVRGNMSSRNQKRKKFADYVLQWEKGVPIAVVEDNNRAMEKVAQVEQRGLLVMATGTGKTYTTFQIIWCLWESQKNPVDFASDRPEHSYLQGFR